jgi:signal transduction histidine kinase
MRLNIQFLRRIKTRIALSFSLLFLAFAIPIIIYAVSQVNLFFNGVYLEQMRAVGLAIAADSNRGVDAGYDSLTAKISRITGSNVYLYGRAGELISRHYEGSIHDTSNILSYPIIEPYPDTTEQYSIIRHKFISFGNRRYLKVQTELPDGTKLLQVKSLQRITMIASRMREVIIWSSFLGLVALIAVAFWVSANISKPVEMLTDFAQKIVGGELPQRISIVSPDEVGDLADALNNIVDELDGARERLMRMETMRRDFFANVREEIERPLGKIRGELTNIAEFPGIAPENSEALDRARIQAQHLHHIIDTLVQISEIEFGEVTLELKTVSVEKLINSVAEEYRARIESKGLKLTIDIPSGKCPATVLGDERLLRVVLQNLLSNAVDFTQKGKIAISAEDHGERLKMTIEDTGSGIPRNEIDRIFERFYRIKTERPPAEDRAGLGLAIAKHILEAHGEKLEAESVLGVGSKFSFWLKKAGDIV